MDNTPFQNRSPKIVGLSDTLLGYGSPQVQKFMSALADHYGTRAMVLEPEVRNREPKHELCPEIDIETIKVKHQPYGWPPGRAEYNWKLADRLNELEPDILVIFCTFCVPALTRLKKKPGKIIYYMIEMVEPYGIGDLWLNIKYRDWFDILVFPERNRAMRDSERCLMMDKPSVIMLNCVNDRDKPEPVIRHDQRNGRILSQGSITYKGTFADYFLEPSAQRFPIDMYGPVSEADDLTERMNKLNANLQYKGIVDGKALAEARRHYSWGIVMWSHKKENTLYAASNKFFEYVASGVPAITAPHPQHVKYVNRYGCGIVMPDWSFDGFTWAIGEAQRITGTDAYPKYVEACARAVKAELNFETQFERFIQTYKSRVAGA